jgi:CubicO group peptidase (beta-lactamase class C family)
MNLVFGLPIARPKQLGFSSERLRRLNSMATKYIDRGDVPCLITLVVRHDQVVHFDVRGMMDIESKKQVEKDTIFRMYSQTKPITAVAVLKLCEEGKLCLSDPVSRYIPAFKNPLVIAYDPPREQPFVMGPFGLTLVQANREITIRDCLTNSTGLAFGRRTPIALFSPEYQVALGGTVFLPLREKFAAPPTMLERMEHLAKLPLSFQPGTAWEYGMSFSLAGVLVEIASGMTLDDFFKEKIFKPLDMIDTSFYLPEDKIDRLSTCYALVNESGQWRMDAVDYPENSDKVKGPHTTFDGGGEIGGVLSTVADYTRFLRMLFNDGELDGVRILRRKSVELMKSNHIGDIFINLRGHGFGSGLGLYVRTDGITGGSLGQCSGSGAACTNFFLDPHEKLFALQFSQVLNSASKPDFTLRDDFGRIIYDALL